MAHADGILKFEGSIKLVCGGIAGCCAKTSVAPFDRTKILLHGHSEHYRNMRPMNVLRDIKVQEGIVGWFRGNGAQMVRIFPYSGIQFMSYDLYKDLCRSCGVDRWLSLDTDKLVCGSLAGMTAVVFTYPLDVVRANLAFHPSEHDTARPRGAILRTIRNIIRSGGHKALYRGLEPTLIGMVPYAGLSFYTFERLKSFCICYCPHLCKSPGGDSAAPQPLSIAGRLVCGSAAGLAAQTAAYPLDVARRSMQLSIGATPDARHWLLVLVDLVKSHGVKNGLFRGLSLNYIRCIPMTAVSFTVYETLSQKAGVLRKR